MMNDNYSNTGYKNYQKLRLALPILKLKKLNIPLQLHLHAIKNGLYNTSIQQHFLILP